MTTSGQRDSGAKYFRASTASTGVARRKWSDWSECSESCLRTRHRLNCDDLATPGPGDQENGNNDDNNLPLLSENSTSKQVVSVVSRRKLEARINQLRRPTPNKDQNLAPREDDDQDYADEGDEDDEDDSCAQVETSKTFEEQNCLGGQCKLLPVGLLPNDASRPPAGSHHHLQAQPRPARPPKGNGYFGLSAAEMEVARHSSRHQTAPSGAGGVGGPRSSSTIEVSSLIQPANHHNLHSTRTNVAANKSAAYFHSHSENRARIELAPAVDNGSELWATRSMWPLSGRGAADQMGNSTLATTPNPQQQHHSLQLTILTAALLSLVLFVALLIRRLFNFTASRSAVVGSNKTATSLVSHNWMMAKSRQDRRRGGGSGKLFSDSSSSASSSSNCRLHHEPAHRNLLERSPSGQQHHFLVGQQLPTGHQSQQPLCYLWERKRVPDSSDKLKRGSNSFAASLSHLAQQFGPSKSQKLNVYGKQPTLFVSLNNQRSSDQQILHTQLGASSSSMSTRAIGLAQLEFDPLYIEPTTTMGPNLSPHSIYNSNQNDCDYDTLDELVRDHNQDRATSLACRSFTQLAGSNHKQPPNVPSAGHSQRAHTEELSSRSLSASSSLSISTMQSATAQLVSNGASGGGGGSSSLDQAPEIVDCLHEPAAASSSEPRPAAQTVTVAAKRRQFKLSNDSNSRGAPELRQTGGPCDSSEQQQHFYEEIGRG